MTECGEPREIPGGARCLGACDVVGEGVNAPRRTGAGDDVWGIEAQTIRARSQTVPRSSGQARGMVACVARIPTSLHARPDSCSWHADQPRARGLSASHRSPLGGCGRLDTSGVPTSPQWSSRTVEDTSARRIPPNPRVNSHRKHPTASGARFASELRSYRAYCGVVVETLFFPRARGQWQVSPPTPHTPRAPRDCIPASCHTPPRPPNLVKRPRRRAPRDSRTPDL